MTHSNYPIVLDTNIIVRLFDNQSSMQPIAETAVRRLIERKHILFLFPQNIREFWNVVTRSLAQNGLGFSLSNAESALTEIEESIIILPDAESTYDIWRGLVTQHQVSGVQVHDCYLAASMKAHGLTHLLTFNPSDFQRYGITTVDPASI